MRNITIIFKKQIKDTFKNKTILIQFILFPLMTLIMENAISLDGMPEHFFAKLFSVMYMGMAPLTAASAIISEEKEKNTLRVLMMANVKPAEYLAGIGSYVWLICMLGASVIGVSSGFSAERFAFYMAVMGVGFIASVLVGAAIGIFAKNQMMATSVVMPVMLIFSFVPMLAMFNETIEKAAQIIYTQQMNLLLDKMSFGENSMGGTCIVLCNLILFVIMFIVAYKRNGLD